MARRQRTNKGGRAAASLALTTSSKRAWTAAEDKHLRALVQKHGTTKWSDVADQMQLRSGKQCRERWHNHLNPEVKKGSWTEEEDEIIITMQAEYGNAWAKITKMLPGRTDNAVKNRWHSSMRSKGRSGSSSGKKSGAVRAGGREQRSDSIESKENNAAPSPVSKAGGDQHHHSPAFSPRHEQHKGPDSEPGREPWGHPTTRVLSPNNHGWAAPSPPPIFHTSTFSFDRGLSPFGDDSLTEWADMMEQDPVLTLPAGEDCADDALIHADGDMSESSRGLPTFTSVAAAQSRAQAQAAAAHAQAAAAQAQAQAHSQAQPQSHAVGGDTLTPQMETDTRMDMAPNKRVRTFSPRWVDVVNPHQSPPPFFSGGDSFDLVRVA